MKLIRCNNCNDVIRLIHTKWRMCDCGKSGGQYNADLLSATVGGDCDVFGISNLFFDDDFRKLSEEEKIEYRKSINHHTSEIWFGEALGDLQIHRVESSRGPRLKMTVEILEGPKTKSIFTDKRKYKLNLSEDTQPPHIIIDNDMNPSFKDENNRKK